MFQSTTPKRMRQRMSARHRAATTLAHSKSFQHCAGKIRRPRCGSGPSDTGAAPAMRAAKRRKWSSMAGPNAWCSRAIFETWRMLKIEIPPR